MLTQEQIASLDALSGAFLDEFRRMLPIAAHKEEITDRLEVTIPSIHPEVGDIVARLDGDEITVSIGQHFHCHFSTYLQDRSSADNVERATAREAVEYIADFMAGDVILRLQFEGESLRSSETYYRHIEVKPPGPDDREYGWSGPLR
jgi:hypothetical protein